MTKQSTGTRKIKRTHPLFPIDIYTTKMIDEIKAFEFPCGETECVEQADYVIHIETVMGDDYEMPACYEHAMTMNVWVEKLTEILNARPDSV